MMQNFNETIINVDVPRDIEENESLIEREAGVVSQMLKKDSKKTKIKTGLAIAGIFVAAMIAGVAIAKTYEVGPVSSLMNLYYTRSRTYHNSNNFSTSIATNRPVRSSSVTVSRPVYARPYTTTVYSRPSLNDTTYYDTTPDYTHDDDVHVSSEPANPCAAIIIGLIAFFLIGGIIVAAITTTVYVTPDHNEGHIHEDVLQDGTVVQTRVDY